MDTIKIRAANDAFRQSGENVILTDRVQALSQELRDFARYKVKTYDDWVAENERTHDFGLFMIEDETYFWKLDVFPDDRREITIGHAAEY